MKRLSVAIPTYGKSPFLSQCLQSIANQTIPVECVVCDGGSIFEFAEQQWEWVKRKSIVPDPGIVTCWSEAANYSQGDYLAFLADDNMLEPNFARQMLAFMEEHPSCEAVFCNQFLMNESGVIDKEASQRMTSGYGRDKLKYGLLKCNDIPHLIKHNSIPLEGCVVKRSVWNKYGQFAQEAFGAFDLYFLVSLLTNGVQFGFLPEYLVKFRMHAGSYTVRKREQHIRGAIWAMQNVKSHDPTINKLINDRLLGYYGQLFKFQLPPAEKAFIQKQLSSSATGLQILTRSIVASSVRKLIPR